MFSRTKPPVKPTRVAPRSTRRFGAGILATHPCYRVPFTAADAAWAAEVFDSGPDDADFDRRAMESAMLDRYTQGFCL